MISFDEAQGLLRASASLLGEEKIPLEAAAGRYLARAVLARSNAPLRAVSTMDGYAIGAEDAGEVRRVIGESFPGARYRGGVGPGEAVRIFTGAAVPDDAVRVVIQEQSEREGDQVRLRIDPAAPRFIREAGSDFMAGDELVPAGARLDPRALVAAAAGDRAELTVARRPRVALLATGDELAAPGEAQRSDETIPDSLSAGLAAMVAADGGEVVLRERGRDDAGALARLAGQALDCADLVVVTGGASVGVRDLAKAMFAGQDLDLVFGKVAIKPGKPVWLGRAQARLVLGLPGNPTSAMVTAALFLRPLLARLQGGEGALHWRRMPLAAPLARTDERETFQRAEWTGDGLVPLGNQDSGAQAALLRADVLIRCAPHQCELPAGAAVDALVF